jgi:hypothetical protein
MMRQRSFRKLLLPLIVVFLSGAQSWSSTSDDRIDRILIDSQKNQTEVQLNKEIHQLKPEQLSLFNHLLNGIYFIDYGHSASELLEIFSNQKRIAEAKFPYLYDQTGEPAYAAFDASRRFLSSQRGPLTFSAVRMLHKLSTPWENSSGKGPGQLRHRFVYGPEFEFGLHADQIEAINKNPYLRFMPATSIYADVPQGQDQAVIGDRVRGAIVYPRPLDLKDEAFARLKNFDPVLAEKVRQYQIQYAGVHSNQSESLTQELVTALLQERISTFEMEQSQIGDLSDPAELRKYVRLIAQFQRDFVSIHPFPDGNGRTSRLLLYHLAERRGLPAPRLIYPNEDLFWTLEMWEQQVKEGMVAALLLKRDLVSRLLTGKPVERSVALLTPAISKVREHDLEYYQKFMEARLLRDSSLKEQLIRDPVGTMRKLENEFKPQKHFCAAIHRAG